MTGTWPIQVPDARHRSLTAEACPLMPPTGSSAVGCGGRIFGHATWPADGRELLPRNEADESPSRRATRRISVRAQCRLIETSERPGLPRRSPFEPLRSRPFCAHTPWLWRPQASNADGFGHGLTAARLEPLVKTGCRRGPFRLALRKNPKASVWVPQRAPMRQSSPGRSYGTASRGRPLRPEVFPDEVPVAVTPRA